MPTFYEEEALPDLHIKGGLVADVLTSWRPDFTKPDLLDDYPDAHWDNSGEIPLRMIHAWKTLYLVRVVCDSTTLLNLSRNPKYYVLASEYLPEKQDNSRMTSEEYWSLREYLVENGMSHAEAAFYVGTNNTMKTVSNNIKDFLNETRSQ